MQRCMLYTGRHLYLVYRAIKMLALLKGTQKSDCEYNIINTMISCIY